MQKTMLLLLICMFIRCKIGNDLATPSNTVSYQIASIADLDNMRFDLDGDYLLIADLDFSGSVFTRDSGWSPIGSSEPFTGSFNGKGHTISNLYINRLPSKDWTGLFAILQNAHIDSLGMVNCSVTGGSYTGALTGRCQSSIIHDCYSEGTVTGKTQVGGLIGLAALSEIQRCYSRDSVEGTTDVGGFAGVIASSSSATNCYSICFVKGLDNVGGFSGRANANTTFNQCYATGRVIATGSTASAGGLTGSLYRKSNIVNCYFNGSVSGTRWVGGLAGCVSDSPLVVTSYCTGSVSESWSNSQGILGKLMDSIIQSSFWNVTTAAGLKLKAGTYGKTTEQLRSITTYTDHSTKGLDSSWNFENIWAIDSAINGGYPYLRGTPVIE